ncbi:hypothetical protein B0A48_17391 [Cryoendolithus antarcticus]|uniref:Peptide transporter PTR2 n=1 Tax=Cryoendolithus antarcticus TaxID=1507870 RepID=A0A1V8SDD8_9PEZI|nr:hypothetical protein B0A48_17391 [Cryoendolithus antarcticus]
MSGNAGGELIADIISTSVPPEVAHPHGKNSLALNDGVGTEDPYRAKRLSVAVDVEADAGRRASAIERENYPLPTEEEARTLRKVADSIPKTAYLLCIVEFAERASYYGVQTVFSNFMQFPLPEGGNGAGAPAPGTEDTAGALGRGEQFSVAIGLLFLFLAYVIPIFGGWLADAKLGRFRTILIGVLICGVSHIIMIIGAIPSVLQAGHAIGPFMLSLILLAIGAGIFKPNVAPTVLDQYQHQKSYTKVLASGEKVVVDPEVTVQRIMLYFYAFINVGAFFAIATTYSEKIVGYWLAFLLPAILYFSLPFLLWYLTNKLIKYPPDGSALTKVYKILKTAIVQSKGVVWKKNFLDSAKPSRLAEQGTASSTVTWSERDVEDVKRTFSACGIFLYFVIYNINDGGIGSVATSQGATMLTKGAPNDLLGNFNPLTIIIFVPFMSYVVYPGLRKYNIKFGRISRITFGFVLATASGVAGAIVQWKIYELSPCGYYATTCDDVAPISIWWQIINVSLGAISEVFANVTAYEVAYSRSPPGMRALVLAIFLFTTALSYALGEVITPAILDPHLIWVWAGPTIALAVQTVIFWFRYRKYNDDEFMIDDSDFNEKVFEQSSQEVHGNAPKTVDGKGA